MNVFALILVWALITHGLVYLMVRAEITQTLRIRLVHWREFFAGLLACDRCSGYWAAIPAYILVLIVSMVLLGHPDGLREWCLAGIMIPAASASGGALEDLLYRALPPKEGEDG